MDSEQWKQIDRLLHAVLEHAPEERDAFLRQACAGDERLEREARSLLTLEQQAKSFLETPAIEVAARVIGRDLSIAPKPLSAGDKLGHYEVVSLLGHGGMGEVYRVRDTKLKRDVALKVLPATFLRDPERMARFQREAQVLASLDHPNIGPIYGMADSEDYFGLVLALVEGPTLEDRIKEAPLAVDEAVTIAKQIVEALEFAHDRSIIHRDLKPANIKITPEGVVKVLDFGLAKVLEVEPPKSSLASSSTMTMEHTRAGMILGTAAYMSPEQAVGRPVDRRSDIFSFGAVLYEMLAGKRAFVGSATPDVLEAVVKNEPDWSALPADTSDTIQPLLRRCLAKDRRQRLQAIGEARIVLENPGGTDRSTQATRLPHKKLPWVVAAMFLLGFGVVSFLHFREQPPILEVTRFAVPAPDKTSFTRAAPAISPDGRTLAFAAIDGEGRSQIWLRPMNSSEAHALPGTEGASAPVFWSPDGRSLAFAGRSLARLMNIDVAGGPAQTLCPATAGVPIGAWSPAGIILFQANDGLMEVPAGGGTCAPVTKLDSKRGELRHTGPSFLPDGRHFLYLRVASKEEDSGVYVGSLDSKPGEQSSKLIAKSASPATYVPSADRAHGYLMFLRQGALMAQPFNAGSLSLAGDAVPIVARVGANGDLFTASENGTLVYRSGGSSGSRQLTWFDRSGRSLGSLGAPGAYTTLSVSPDGKRVAFGVADTAQNNTDIWVHDLAQRATIRFTFDPAVDDMPVWSPDGTRIVWSSQREGGADLYQRASNLAGDETALLKSPEPKFPQDWSSDGRFLIYSVNRGDRGGNNLDLWLLPLKGEQKPTQFLGTPFTESQGRFSPDCRYIAYVSNESGKTEVYVRSFSSDGKAGGQQMISQGGGSQPLWRRDGKELFYISADSKVMAVPVSTAPTFRRVGAPVALFTAPIYGGGRNTHRWAAMPDGQKFIINSVLTEAVSEPITAIMNWTQLLKK
ncbi:MAG: serine/threonine-protein kinase [Acidobacteriia bacterium]|nr:serine/threonine-protein kinase [Terriglobia bacterium]